MNGQDNFILNLNKFKAKRWQSFWEFVFHNYYVSEWVRDPYSYHYISCFPLYTVSTLAREESFEECGTVSGLNKWSGLFLFLHRVKRRIRIYGMKKSEKERVMSFPPHAISATIYVAALFMLGGYSTISVTWYSTLLPHCLSFSCR